MARAGILWFLIFTLFLASTAHGPAFEQAWAREQPSAAAGTAAPDPGLAHQPTVEDFWQVQAVLAALGMYEGSLTGIFDAATRDALQRLQRRYGLPATGLLDPETLAFLGGPAAGLDRQVRFLYTVQPGDTLSVLAARFGVPVPRILRFNPSITSMHRIYAGHQLVIPVEFPIPAQFEVLRLQVLPERFLGSYLADVSFADADRLADEFVQLLKAHGFDVQVEQRALDGITVRNAAIGLGRITFSPYRSEGRTRVDVGLLVAGSGAARL